MSPQDPFAPVWKKSTRSGNSLGCVETALLPVGSVGVRDSKHVANSPVLSFTQSEWRGLIGAVKNGSLDLA
jgi:hypothetical protein